MHDRQINPLQCVPKVTQFYYKNITGISFYLKLLYVSTPEGHHQARMCEGQWRTFKILIAIKSYFP
jgi:hypothetical protein